jgi:hypothetical protein
VTGIAEFISDEAFLGRDFAGPSWDAWRITLKGAFGEAMTLAERARFRELAGRDPPARRVREAWLAIGRRAGKDSIASAVATYLAVFGKLKKHLRRGERATVLCLAVDRTQAGIVFNYIKSYFDEIPLLHALLVRADNGVVELNNGVDIIVATNSFRAVRDRTVACAILDDLAFWRDEKFANPDVEVYNALMPSLITLWASGAMLIAISTVYRKQGLLYEKFVKHHGRDDDDVLYLKQPSNVFNPRLDEPEQAAEIARLTADDPERAAAEWLSVWRSDLSSLLDRAVMEALVDLAVYEEREPSPCNHYVAFSDESGGNGGDASTLAIAHLDNNKRIVQDLIRVWKPPFSPSAVIKEKAKLLKLYRIRVLVGDGWAGGLPADLYRTEAITYTKSELNKSEIYIAFLHLANSGRPILDHPPTIGEALGLERRVRWGGGESVDHPTSGHDDAINALAGACVLAATGEPDVVETWIRAWGNPGDLERRRARLAGRPIEPPAPLARPALPPPELIRPVAVGPYNRVLPRPRLNRGA